MPVIVTKKFLLGDYHLQTTETLTRSEFIKRLGIITRLRTKKKDDGTLGNPQLNGNAELFKVRVTETRVYKVHADTRMEAIRAFYKNRNNPWRNCQGAVNAQVLTNSPDGNFIQGLYIYLLT